MKFQDVCNNGHVRRKLVMSVTDKFTGAAKGSLVCCLHSFFQFEVSENNK